MPPKLKTAATFEVAKANAASATATVLSKIVGQILGHHLFDHLMGAVIVFNMIVMIVETDRGAESDEEDPGHWTSIVGWIILFLFIIELAGRIYTLKSLFWKEPWNVFDFFVVVLDTLLSLMGFVFGSLFPVSSLRVLRLAKLARVSKILKVFPELRIMMAGLLGSISALFWGTVLLILVVLVWAIIAVQFLHPINKTIDYGSCERCGRAYSSVMASMLTLCQILVTGDSWGTTSVPLIEASPIAGLFFTFSFLSVTLGVMNLILGVVVNVFTDAHDRIVQEIEDQKLIEKMETQRHLIAICEELDNDGSGQLSQDEMQRGFEHEDFAKTMDELGIEPNDLDIVWTIMDTDKSGTVSYSEFVQQIYKMHLSDTQFMLAYVKFYVCQIMNRLEESDRRREAEDAKLEEELEKAEKVEEQLLKAEQEETRKIEEEESLILQKVSDKADVQQFPSTEEKQQKQPTQVDDRSFDLRTRWQADYEALLVDSREMQSELRDFVKGSTGIVEQQITKVATLLQEVVATQTHGGRNQPALIVTPDRTSRGSCCLGQCWRESLHEGKRAIPPSSTDETLVLAGKSTNSEGQFDLPVLRETDQRQ